MDRRVGFAPREDKVCTIVMFSRDHVVPINRHSVARPAEAGCGNLSGFQFLITV